MKTTDYIFCETCDGYVDFYHFDYDIDDAGHKGHKWRYVTEKELKVCVKDCKENHCEGMY
jgi:hypothetical protein